MILLFFFDSWSIWEGILEDLGRSGEEFGRIWEGLVRNLGGFWSLSANSGQILEMLGIIWPCWGAFSIRTPALVREASQYAGVPNPQTRVESMLLVTS